MGNERVSDQLTIEVDEIEGRYVLALKGELDLASAPVLVARADELLAEGRPLVLDLRNLSFIDSTGLGALAGIDRNARQTDTPMTLIPGPPNVQRVFEISGTTDAFGWSEAPA